MSHEIKYLTFDVTTPKSQIDAEIQHYVRCRTIEEGGHGLISPIRWRDDTVYESYDIAYEQIQSMDRTYDQIAVKYREYPRVEPSAAIVALEERLKKVTQDRADYATKHSVSTFKAEFVGCSECGSRLKKTLLRSEKCPLCGTDLRGNTTLENLKRYNERLEEIRKKIQDERMKQRAKLVKQSKIKWLIKIEYHV